MGREAKGRCVCWQEAGLDASMPQSPRGGVHAGQLPGCSVPAAVAGPLGAEPERDGAEPQSGWVFRSRAWLCMQRAGLHLLPLKGHFSQEEHSLRTRS